MGPADHSFRVRSAAPSVGTNGGNSKFVQIELVNAGKVRTVLAFRSAMDVDQNSDRFVFGSIAGFEVVRWDHSAVKRPIFDPLRCDKPRRIEPADFAVRPTGQRFINKAVGIDV